MSAWQHCRRLSDGELFLLSATNPASFDSRYVGPIAAAAVIGTAHPLWTWNKQCTCSAWRRGPCRSRALGMRHRCIPSCKSLAASVQLRLHYRCLPGSVVRPACGWRQLEAGPRATGEERGQDKGTGTPRPAKSVCTLGWRGTVPVGARALPKPDSAPALGLPRAASDALRRVAPECPFPVTRVEAFRRVKVGTLQGSLSGAPAPRFATSGSPHRASSHPHLVSLRSSAK